jgi:hypothetical protein
LRTKDAALVGWKNACNKHEWNEQQQPKRDNRKRPIVLQMKKEVGLHKIPD